MMKIQMRGRPRLRAVRGFSQIEIVASTAMLGLVMTATLSSIAASRTRTTSEMIRLQGQSLANELMVEILAFPACDPDDGPPTDLGLESGESDGANRSKWDDVDDYYNLSESPPKNRMGIDIKGFANWSRQTSIQRLESGDWTLESGEYQQAYRVSVTVSRDGQAVATAVGYKNGDLRTSSPFQGP